MLKEEGVGLMVQCQGIIGSPKLMPFMFAGQEKFEPDYASKSSCLGATSWRLTIRPTCASKEMKEMIRKV